MAEAITTRDGRPGQLGGVVRDEFLRAPDPAVCIARAAEASRFHSRPGNEVADPV
jgi:hypothetical protein